MGRRRGRERKKRKEGGAASLVGQTQRLKEEGGRCQLSCKVRELLIPAEIATMVMLASYSYDLLWKQVFHPGYMSLSCDEHDPGFCRLQASLQGLLMATIYIHPVLLWGWLQFELVHDSPESADDTSITFSLLFIRRRLRRR